MIFLIKRLITKPPSVLLSEPRGDRPKRPEPPRGRAPGPSGRSYIDRFGADAGNIGHPILDQLHRKAANELFHWLGVVVIPRQYWEILKTVGDGPEAVQQLLLALGCDPVRVRRRDPEELARLYGAIDVVVELDSLRPHLSREHLQEIEYLLFTSNYDTVNRFVRVVGALSGIISGRERSSALRVFAVYRTFLADIEQYLRNPLMLDPKEADDGLRLSDKFLAKMEEYAVSHENISSHIEDLLDEWPDSLESGHECDLRNGMILRFREIDEALLNDAGLNLSLIDSLVEECAVLKSDLEALYSRVCGGAGSFDEPDRADPLKKALDFYGFAAGATPSPVEIQKAWRDAMKKYHPDHSAGSTNSEELLRRAELAKQANIHRDILRRKFCATA